MSLRARRVGSILLVVGLALTLTSCFGHWLTPPPIAKLIVSDPIRVGGKYEVTISVADMPDGGVAGIQLGTAFAPAIDFDHVNVATITAVGLSGFEVISQTYTAGPPVRGCLIAVYGPMPIESGAILKLSFDATGSPAVTLDETRVSLASGVPAWIAAWDLVADIAYYTKEAGAR